MTLIYDEDDDSQYIDIDEDQILSGLSAQELEQLEVCLAGFNNYLSIFVRLY